LGQPPEFAPTAKEPPGAGAIVLALATRHALTLGTGAIAFAFLITGRISPVAAWRAIDLDLLLVLFALLVSVEISAWHTALAFKSYEDVNAALQQGNFYPVAVMALLSATSPNAGARLNVEFPYLTVRGELLRAHPAYDKWLAQFPVHAVAAHRDNLLKLRTLALDFGYDDQFAHIPPSAMAFSRALYDERIPYRLDVYQGDHREKVSERLERIVLPFVSNALERQ
jgi:hypothetical protein